MPAPPADLLRRAHAAYKEGDHFLAFELYKQLADAGHTDSQVFVAWMLSLGVGCEKNEAQAAIYYERAAALGNPVGCFNFGRWLTRAGDHKSAYGFYLQGAACKHLPSMFRVGLALARGKGVAVDLPRAYNILGLAALRGHAYALREMAVQDLRGKRGLLLMPVGLLEFVAAICWGVAVSIVNKDSDLLRG